MALNIAELETKTLSDLHEMAKELEIGGFVRMRKQDLIIKLMHIQTEQAGNIFSSGILDIVSDGFGFLRSERMLPGPDDVYVSQSQIRRFGLRTGDRVAGQVRPPKENERYFSLLRVELIKMRAVACYLWIDSVDEFNAQQAKVALVLFRRAYLPRNPVAGAEAKATDLGLGDINIVGSGQHALGA